MTQERERFDGIVVGAGISGLLAATVLRDRGLRVLVLDKGRGVGGRLATRRIDPGVFDHGAQHFTVREPEFAARVEAWVAAGVVRPWTTDFGVAEGHPTRVPEVRYCGVGGMTAIAKHLAVGLDVRLRSKVTRVEWVSDGWRVITEEGGDFLGRSLMLTSPVPQTLSLLRASGVPLPAGVQHMLEGLEYAPCLALMVQLTGPSRVPEPGGIWLSGEPVAWMADNQRKGISPQGGAAVTVHAGPEFSRIHWETPEPEVTRLLLEAAAPWLGSGVITTQLHRWRYSLPLTIASESHVCIRNPAPLVLAGDAFGGARVEGAAVSGLEAAAELSGLLVPGLRADAESGPAWRAGLILGTFIGDAHAMPAHWYYDREALRRDYGELKEYATPRNPHPDSILWRSSYTPSNARGDILHDQARFWGQRGIHYHQFLKAGENTLNLQLGRELIASLQNAGRYDPDDYLARYLDFMLTPGRHRDTYVEECHRKFFTAYARGTNPRQCAGADIHIGGLAHVGILCAFFGTDTAAARDAVREHVRLTHRSDEVESAADALTQMVGDVIRGADLREAILVHGRDWLSESNARRWLAEPDDVVIGRRVSPACYIGEAFPASLYLAWKYAGDPEGGILANTRVGGDNCHRGAVVGALLGVAAGDTGIPGWLRDGLLATSSLAGFARDPKRGS